MCQRLQIPLVSLFLSPLLTLDFLKSFSLSKVCVFQLFQLLPMVVMLEHCRCGDNLRILWLNISHFVSHTDLGLWPSQCVSSGVALSFCPLLSSLASQGYFFESVTLIDCFFLSFLRWERKINYLAKSFYLEYVSLSWKRPQVYFTEFILPYPLPKLKGLILHLQLWTWYSSWR